MEKSQSTSSHQRLRELLAIPERQRTEAQWDEINELEIMLTPANRIDAPAPRKTSSAASDQPKPRDGAPAQPTPRKTSSAASDQPKPREGAQGKWALRKPRKRPPRGVP